MPSINVDKRPKISSSGNMPHKATDPGIEDEELEDSYDEDMNDEESDHEGFPNHDKMPAQQPATRTTAQLFELMAGDKPYLDLNPHYQRNVVWSRKAKQMLIDSMFAGFFIPPVIFNVTKLYDEGGSQRYKRTCVDGKQRLSSIRDFMRGRFPWKLRNKDWYRSEGEDSPPEMANPVSRYYDSPVNEDGSAMAGAKSKLVLPDKQKHEFANKHLLCVEYMDLTQTQEIELFQRVQLGKPLTKAETFKASQGAWQDLGRKFEEDYADILLLSRQNNRASQFWMVLSCFSQIYECMYPSSPTAFPKLKIRVPQIEKLCSDEKSLDRKTKSHLRMVFDKFLDLVIEDRSLFESSHYKHTKAFSPIELTAVCCLISQWGEERPIGMLQGDIRLLRDHLRSCHHDLRASEPHWKTCWNYINDLEGIRGAVGGGTITKSSTIPSTQITHQQKTPLTASAKRAKTGRKPAENDGDNDFRPSATARRTGVGHGGRSRPKAAPINYDISSHAAGQGRGAPQPEDQRLSAGDSSSSSLSDTDSAWEQVRKPAKAPTAPMGDGQTARKRALMDLGGSGSTARDLEAKKARMIATRFKQEE